jgi:hypothetical protein
MENNYRIIDDVRKCQNIKGNTLVEAIESNFEGNIMSPGYSLKSVKLLKPTGSKRGDKTYARLDINYYAPFYNSAGVDKINTKKVVNKTVDIYFSFGQWDKEFPSKTEYHFDIKGKYNL